MHREEGGKEKEEGFYTAKGRSLPRDLFSSHLGLKEEGWLWEMVEGHTRPWYNYCCSAKFRHYLVFYLRLGHLTFKSC